ncbi:EF-hand calcium-binding domain-containing protein 6-like [Anser cygnoides]|uniref:EF-hand calcium-binding domain-containing protein 6-like n=1 Tax=Anser cygnoides TaxID=8845 RepID=UPI0034D2B33A
MDLDLPDHNQQVIHSKTKKRSLVLQIKRQLGKSLNNNNKKRHHRDACKDYFQDFKKAFHKMDKNRDGCVTVFDLHRILQEFNCYLDHDQLSSLLNRLRKGKKSFCLNLLRSCQREANSHRYQK